MSAAAPFDAVIERILAGQAPPAIRAAAARGALPLPRTALVRLFLHLQGDDDEAIRVEAQNSLDALPADAVLEIVGDEECAPEVLEHFAGAAAKNEAMAERIAFHPSVPGTALAKLAAAGNSSVIDLVLTNQERLLVHPDLLTVLSMNPALRADQRGRILDLLDRATRAVDASEGTDAEAGEGSADGPEVSEEVIEAARVLQVDIGELYVASEILGGDELLESDDPLIRTAYQKILTLNVAQKAVLAMRGGREERLILVRDSNKLVALSVLRNPRIVEEDIEAIARMRNVTEEVLRQIGQSREWTKSYTVVKILTHNPRTPQSIAANFVGRIQTHDLRRLTMNKDVPELIRRMAKRTLDLRTQKRR